MEIKLVITTETGLETLELELDGGRWWWVDESDERHGVGTLEAGSALIEGIERWAGEIVGLAVTPDDGRKPELVLVDGRLKPATVGLYAATPGEIENVLAL